MNGTTVNLDTFARAEARDNWLKTAKQFGGSYLVGDNWIVWTDARAPAEQIQKTLGGRVE